MAVRNRGKEINSFTKLSISIEFIIGDEFFSGFFLSQIDAREFEIESTEKEKNKPSITKDSNRKAMSIW